MMPLETEFYSRGFCHKLVRRAGFVATYARWRRSNPPGPVHSEVVVIRRQKAHTHNEIEYPEREVYPSSEQWGTYGWTYQDEDQARAKFEALVQASDSMRARDLTTAITTSSNRKN